MKDWSRYALAALGLTIVCAGLATLAMGTAYASALWFSATLAYALQLAAFAALIAVRDHTSLFVLGWAGGMVLRFLGLGIVAFWLTRSGALPTAAVLVSFVSYLFLLLMLEPLFLRRAPRALNI